MYGKTEASTLLRAWRNGVENRPANLPAPLPRVPRVAHRRDSCILEVYGEFTPSIFPPPKVTIASIVDSES